MLMGFIRMLLTGVSSAALLMVGAAAQAADNLPSETKRLKIVITPPPNRVEASIQKMFERMTVERVRELRKFARELRELKLEPVAEVIAVETMLSMIFDLPRSIISEAQATEVTGRIFDEFVGSGPLLVTDPAGRTVDTSPGRSLFAPPAASFEPVGYQG